MNPIYVIIECKYKWSLKERLLLHAHKCTIVFMTHNFLHASLFSHAKYNIHKTTSFDPISFNKRNPLASYFIRNNEYYYNTTEKTKTISIYSHHFTFHFLHLSQKHVSIIFYTRYFSRLFRGQVIWLGKIKKCWFIRTHIMRN